MGPNSETKHSTPTGGGASPLAAALSYAARGWAVFPLQPGTKEPATAHGFRDATTDEALLRKWWVAMPGAGVGIATGDVSGLAVVDIDPRHGGDDSLKQLEAEGLKLPDGPIARTGGGGTHYYLKTGGVVPTVPAFHRGLDLKGEGGYVVAPPSWHPSGGSYEWWRSPEVVELAPVPAWLMDMVAKRQHQGRPLQTVPETIPEGARNETMFKLAASLRAKGLSGAGILAALRVENAARCQPKLPDEELEAIAK